METTFLNTPIGTLQIEGSEKGISKIIFIQEETNSSKEIPRFLKEAHSQLQAYFNKELKDFDLKLAPQGTDFQQKVWQQLQTIPFGKTTSYQHMANQLGDPKVIRAAASANGKNPIAIVIPCHRVIGTDGSLTGYAGGLHRKKWLLEHECPVKQGELF